MKLSDLNTILGNRDASPGVGLSDYTLGSKNLPNVVKNTDIISLSASKRLSGFTNVINDLTAIELESISVTSDDFNVETSTSGVINVQLQFSNPLSGNSGRLPSNISSSILWNDGSSQYVNSISALPISNLTTYSFSQNISFSLVDEGTSGSSLRLVLPDHRLSGQGEIDASLDFIEFYACRYSYDVSWEEIETVYGPVTNYGLSNYVAKFYTSIYNYGTCADCGFHCRDDDHGVESYQTIPGLTAPVYSECFDPQFIYGSLSNPNNTIYDWCYTANYILCTGVNPCQSTIVDNGLYAPGQGCYSATDQVAIDWCYTANVPIYQSQCVGGYDSVWNPNINPVYGITAPGFGCYSSGDAGAQAYCASCGCCYSCILYYAGGYESVWNPCQSTQNVIIGYQTGAQVAGVSCTTCTAATGSPYSTTCVPGTDPCYTTQLVTGVYLSSNPNGQDICSSCTHTTTIPLTYIMSTEASHPGGSIYCSSTSVDVVTRTCKDCLGSLVGNDNGGAPYFWTLPSCIDDIITPSAPNNIPSALLGDINTNQNSSGLAGMNSISGLFTNQDCSSGSFNPSCLVIDDPGTQQMRLMKGASIESYNTISCSLGTINQLHDVTTSSLTYNTVTDLGIFNSWGTFSYMSSAGQSYFTGLTSYSLGSEINNIATYGNDLDLNSIPRGTDGSKYIKDNSITITISNPDPSNSNNCA